MIEMESHIAEVSVYPGQAQIVRRGRVELVQPGPTELQLADLPLNLLADSVRVTGEGTARVRLLGVKVRRTHYAAAPEEELARLDAQIEQLEDQDRGLEEQIQVRQHRLEMLAGLAGEAPDRLVRGFTWGKVDLEGMGALLGFVSQGEDEARAEIRRLQLQRRELARKLEPLRSLRRDRGQSDRPDRYTVHVPLEVREPGELEIALIYVCQNANWQPLYDLRIQEGEPGQVLIRLGQLAEISQRTGEDWSGVELSVSTARPALAAALPKLRPWYIDLYRPAPPPPPQMAKMRTAAAPSGAALEEEMAIEDRVGAVEGRREEAEVAVAEISREGPAMIFSAPGRADVPADGSAHKVFLGTHELRGALDWVAAPKLEAHAYRRAKVENRTPAVLLAGGANLFYGDTFIGKTDLPETPLEGEIEIHLGVDEQVQVEREQVERRVDKGGLVGKVRQMIYGYRIRLRNFRQERIALTVWDQLPVSRHENLKVKLLASTPEVVPGEMGELRWELSLAPGEERNLAFSFQVELPLEQEAVGLP
ncbi:MAG: mucoidy inhibitor MuiA family protein [Chloroflexia bacterium]|nr:mucoidy inhibitor MuiA family protein [Chloroflexia bacterium]